jgi:hypothetical protein
VASPQATVPTVKIPVEPEAEEARNLRVASPEMMVTIPDASVATPVAVKPLE